MPVISTVSSEGFATYVGSTPHNNWSATSGVTIPSGVTAVNVNVSVEPVAGQTAFTAGSYSINYTAKDGSGNQYDCTPNPASSFKTAANSVVNFTGKISVPTNLSGNNLPSPLTITMTLTNVGGGGDTEDPK